MFRLFRRQLMHESLKAILTPLKPFMTKPDVVKCPDGHYRCLALYLGETTAKVILR